MWTAWKEHLHLWRVVTWTAVVVLLALLIVNSRKPTVDEALERAVIPLIGALIIVLVDQRRKGRSVPRSLGYALLTLLAGAVFLAASYGFGVLFGRPRGVDPFSDSIGPPASYVAAVIVICLLWAAVAKQLDLGPWDRKRRP